MNIESYKNAFPEIRHLNDERQLALLERARYEAVHSFGMLRKMALYLFLSVFTGLMMPLISVLMFGFNVLANAVAMGLGAVMSIVVYRFLYGRLLRQGLACVLSGAE